MSVGLPVPQGPAGSLGPVIPQGPMFLPGWAPQSPIPGLEHYELTPPASDNESLVEAENYDWPASPSVDS